jgi:hypothetical protein
MHDLSPFSSKKDKFVLNSANRPKFRPLFPKAAIIQVLKPKET